MLQPAQTAPLARALSRSHQVSDLEDSAQAPSSMAQPLPRK